MLRIAIADDHPLIRRSLVLLIETFDGMAICLEAEDGSKALEKLKTIPVDVLLLDIQMPVLDGFHTCKRVRNEYPDIKILIVSQLMSKDSVQRALEAGAHGYFTKSSHPSHLEGAIRSVYEKDFYVDPELKTVFHELIFWKELQGRPKDPLSLLSEREIEIVRLASQGLDGNEIAEKLFINKRTVESHRQRIMAKIEAKSFTSVILLAVKYNYITLENI
jgi:two-component system response regulator DegU